MLVRLHNSIMFKQINVFNISYIISIGLLVESALMLTILPFAFFETSFILLRELTSCGIITSIGLLMFYISKSKQTVISRRESFLIAFLMWFVMSTLGALPYYLTLYIPQWYDAIFESVSGFTTTGSSVLNDIEALPKSLLFWRAMTHWIGGLGILVLVVALIPFMNTSGNNLVLAEGNFVETERIKPKMIEVAKTLWVIYIILTFLETVLLWIEGLSLFDAVCHSFATVATGGFSTKNTSAIEMSSAVQYTLSIFMILSGMNFVLHYHLYKFQFRKLLLNIELKYYLSIIGVSVVLISLFQFSTFSKLPDAFRSALFQVSSVITATGFASDDYEVWAPGGRAVIALLMLVGACVGSTGGGIKVKRHVIAIKSIKLHFYRMIHPNAICRVKYGDLTVSNENIYKASSFIGIYIITLLVGTLILMSVGVDFRTSSSSIATTLAGIGPGFGNVGPLENFYDLPVFAKMYLCFNMVLGRIEIIPLLAIFHPSFRRP